MLMPTSEAFIASNDGFRIDADCVRLRQFVNKAANCASVN